MIRFRPLSDWPGSRTPRDKRRAGDFRIQFANLLKSLEREMAHLGARDAVIEAAVEETELRILDGWLRADARPRDPGIILNIESKFGPLRLPCDHFKEWRDNLRAIALHLENLRHAGMYGVGSRGEQYRGWAALPPATPLVTPAKMTVEQAARFIAAQIGAAHSAAVSDILASPDTFQTCYRSAAKKLHPDNNNSVISESWQRLMEAAALLRGHHGA